MKSTIDEDTGQLFDLNFIINLLDRFYPRLVSQIDRDPNSPTYGSCDRQYWMYRLHDFDSGVLQQASLTFAVLDQLADHTDFSTCRNLSNAHQPYWRELALAVNRRTVGLMGKSGFLDEYYPGERSFPATVFAAYATLKSATMLDQQEIISSQALALTAEMLLERSASPATNQDTACAAFLTLYGKTRNWEVDRVKATADRLLIGADGKVRFQEYGGLDLGYATVSLNYLACMLEDGGFPAGKALDELAHIITDFVTPRGRLGGEFAARSTTYFLPFGVLLAAIRGCDPEGRLSQLDLAGAFDKLDDRYLMHYCLPSLALAGLKLARDGAINPAQPNNQFGWITSDHRSAGIFVCRSAEAVVFVGLNKGGAVHAEASGETFIDCGYRAQRGGKVFATCVIGDAPNFQLNLSADGMTLEIEAPFRKYTTLVASPLKTVILRFLGFMGPTLNAYFKSRLIKSTRILAGAILKRRISVKFESRKIAIEDEIIGLRPSDSLYRSPTWSLRLVPSAKFYQDGEAEYFNDHAGKMELKERTFARVVDLD